MMAYNKFHKNCPDFKIGQCTSYKTCKYKYHKKCPDNFLCEYEDCDWGHGISYMKRIIINNIKDKKSSDYNKCDMPMNCSDNMCKMPMNCINKNCECDHYPFDYDDRTFIYNIINHTITDENAWSNYEKKYNSYSPVSSTMSSSSTVPSMYSPCPLVSSSPLLSGSYASLFKEKCNTDIEDDSMMAIIEDMKNIRRNIDVDTKKVASIKDQIKKLEEELVNTEENVKKDKNKLKELAVKIAEC